jgi:hypothetical protein
MSLRSLAFSILLSGNALAAPTLVLNDPLTAPQASGQTVTGGTFSSAGWTRDSFQSQIVYDLGNSITAGRVIFEMDGVNGVDHGVGGFPDCRAIFGAVDSNGSGDIDGPGNENVQFLWAWAMEETDYCNGGPGGFERTHKMKLLVHGGAPEEPGEPMSDPLSWDITTFYTFEIGWDQNHAWLLRDGAMVLDQVYPSAPVIMNMRYVFLGTVHRYDAGVKNATFRNLEIWDDGGPTNPPPTDSGTCLSAGSLTPAHGGGLSADLSVTYSHCEGASAFRIVQLWVGDEVASGVPALSLGYEAGELHLDGSAEACAPGDPTVLTSSHGSLDCAKTTVTQSGNDVIVSWSLGFDAQSFAGTHQVFVDAKGGTGSPEPRLGWTNLGTFTVSSSWTDGGLATGGTDGAGNPARGSTLADDSGCGCRTSRSGGATPWMFLALLLVCRRRMANRCNEV